MLSEIVDFEIVGIPVVLKNFENSWFVKKYISKDQSKQLLNRSLVLKYMGIQVVVISTNFLT